MARASWTAVKLSSERGATPAHANQYYYMLFLLTESESQKP
jgi:hypothetical protein